jgi:hypothetical protein
VSVDHSRIVGDLSWDVTLRTLGRKPRWSRSIGNRDYIVTQPRRDAKQWDAVVTKIPKVCGDLGSDFDF